MYLTDFTNKWMEMLPLCTSVYFVMWREQNTFQVLKFQLSEVPFDLGIGEIFKKTPYWPPGF